MREVRGTRYRALRRGGDDPNRGAVDGERASVVGEPALEPGLPAEDEVGAVEPDEALDAAMDFAAQLGFLIVLPSVETIYVTQRNGMDIFPIPTDPRLRVFAFLRERRLGTSLQHCMFARCLHGSS